MGTIPPVPHQTSNIDFDSNRPNNVEFDLNQSIDSDLNQFIDSDFDFFGPDF